MPNITNFKLVLSVIFGVFILLGIFAIIMAPGNSNTAKGKVVVWGIFDEKTMHLVFDPLKTNALEITYVQKSSDTYDQDLIEAFASEKGPDVFIMPEDMIMRFRNKTYTLPKEMITERSFRDTFIEEGELYISKNGIMGLPMFVDPMVLYWNRDAFSVAGVTQAPASWSELLALVPKFTTYNDRGEITRPAVALGEFQNIDHAKDILALLFFQTGSAITKETEGALMLDFRENAAESVIRFYTEFAKPGKDIYTWNRSLPSSREMFISGDLPMYLGYASEMTLIKEQNPHLNIDVAQVPQLAEGGKISTYGALSGVAIAKGTKNATGAMYVLSGMTTVEAMKIFSTNLNVAPARRALLSAEETDVYRTIFNRSALITKSWLDPEPETSYTIFKDATESVTGGRARLSEAVYAMEEEFRQLIKTTGFGSGVY